MLKHIVLFSYSKPLDDPEIIEIDRRFRDLPSKIAEVKAFESGVDLSVEGLAKGFDKAYVLSFDSAKDRDIYFHHPMHQDFVSQVKDLLDDVLVFDYAPE